MRYEKSIETAFLGCLRINGAGNAPHPLTNRGELNMKEAIQTESFGSGEQITLFYDKTVKMYGTTYKKSKHEGHYHYLSWDDAKKAFCRMLRSIVQSNIRGPYEVY